MNVICLNDAVSKLNANVVDIWGKTLIVHMKKHEVLPEAWSFKRVIKEKHFP